MKIEIGKFFLRVGAFYIGRLPKPSEPEFLPELIVCSSHRQAREVRQSLPDDYRARGINVVWPTIAQLSYRTYPRITVLPGVDLDADVGGEGRLRTLLASRQQAFGGQSFIVDLTSKQGGQP